MSDFWHNIRQDFSITREGIYLDHAAGGPIPQPVLHQIEAHYRENAGYADFAWMRWVKQREEVREKVAAWIHADPEEVAFTQGTSHGMNLVADLIASKGKVLTNRSEFPSTTIPWIARKVKLKWQKPKSSGRLPIQQLQKQLSKDVKTILSSYVQYGTGFRQDLEAIGKIKGKRFFVVNATQGFGALGIDVRKWNADFMVTNSYKWLMAGYGGGVLYIRKKHLKELKPSIVGWRSMKNPERMKNSKIDLAVHGRRYELGCPPFASIIAIGAAIDYLSKIGVAKIEDRVLELSAYASGSLKRAGFQILSSEAEKERSGIVIFKMKDAESVWKRLLAQKIYVSPRGGGLRIAPHFYNTFDEIDALIHAVCELSCR